MSVHVFFQPRDTPVHGSPPAGSVNAPLGASETLIAALALVPVLVSVKVRSSDEPTATLPKAGDGLEVKASTGVVPAWAGAARPSAVTATARVVGRRVERRIAVPSGAGGDEPPERCAVRRSGHPDEPRRT